MLSRSLSVLQIAIMLSRLCHTEKRERALFGNGETGLRETCSASISEFPPALMKRMGCKIINLKLSQH